MKVDRRCKPVRRLISRIRPPLASFAARILLAITHRIAGIFTLHGHRERDGFHFLNPRHAIHEVPVRDDKRLLERSAIETAIPADWFSH